MGEFKQVSKEFYVNFLKQGIYTAVFTKRDGTERVMKCTLKSSLLPETQVVEKEKLEYSDDQVRVWDLEAEAWRSFKISNLVSFSPV